MIRFIVGFLVVLGAVGGIENDPTASLLVGTGLAALGLALMAWPVLDGTVSDNSLRSY